MADVLASLMIKLGLDASEVQSGARKTQGILGDLQRDAGLAAAAGGAAIGDFVASGVGDYIRLDTRMREVFTLMPGLSGQAKDAMTQDARDFAKEFGISTDVAIGGLYDALSSGVPKDDVFEYLTTAQKAATAGVTDLSSSVGLLSAVTKGYGDTSQEATLKASDLAFTTVRLGQTTFPELAASIGKVVPQAKALGISQEELFGTVATLTGVTGNTSEVMTQLKAVETSLIKPSVDLAKVYQEQGYESGKAAIEALGFAGTLDMLEDAAGGSDTELAKMLGSGESLTAVLALTGAQAEKAADDIEQMGDVTGATTTAFEEMDSGLAAQGRKVAAFFDDLKLTVGKEMQSLGPIIYAVGPSMGRWLGHAFGAGFGLLAKEDPRLMAPVLGKMAAAITGGNLGTSMATALSGGLTKANIMGSLRMVGSSWGRMLGIGAAVAMGAIIVAELQQLKEIRDANVAQAAANDGSMKKLLEAYPTRREAEAALAGLKAIPGELEGVQGALMGIGDIGQGNVLGSAFDVAFGSNPAENLDKQIGELERYLATDLPETENSIGSAVTRMLKGGYDAAAAAMARMEPPTIDTGMDEAVKDDFAKARQAIMVGFGSVKAALANPPQLISKSDRIENMEGRMKKVMRNLNKAVKADDPINIKYWSDAAVKQAGQLDKMKGKSGSSTRQIRRKFEAMGVDLEGTWLDVGKKADESSQGAQDSATTAATETVASVKSIFGGVSMFQDGVNLITTWANGLLAAKATAVAAGADVAAAVAAYFESHSPPRTGPLSGIDEWGEPLIDAWARPIETRGLARARKAAGAVAGAFAPSIAGGLAVGAAGAAIGGDTIQVGVLVADEAGLDELDRRLNRRRARTSRGRRLYNDVG